MRVSPLLGLVFSVAPVLPAFGEYAQVHGINMYYEIHGEGSPVVLLHGGLATIRLSFEKQIPELTRTHRLVAMEQIGHGHTADVAGRDFTYEGMTEDTATLLAQLGIRNADVIGWSDGGQLALRLAFTHPEFVRKIIVSGVSLSATVPEEIERRKHANEALNSDLWPEATDEYGRISPDGAQHWAAFFAKVRAMWARPSRGTSDRDLADIKKPSLIIAGDEENVERHVRIFRGIAGAKLCILPATGHGTFLDRAPWLNPIILEFLDQN